MTDHPSSPRERLLLPILLPVITLVVIGAVLFLFSRILLNVTHTAATVTALAVAAGILVVATFVASRRHVTRGAVLSMIGGVLGIAMVTGGIALLVAPPAEEGGGGEPAVITLAAPPNAAADGYSTDQLTAPAGVPFTIAFDNQDPNVQHNVDIAQDENSTGSPIFEGPIITGPDSIQYQVDALDPGTYFFFCKVHPTTMTGTLTVEEGATPGGGGGGGGGGVTSTVVAQNLQFDTDTINLPANQETTVTLDNKDAGVPHNIAIFTDESQQEVLFRGDLLTGPGTIDYTIPALDPGTYYFHCDVHPDMNGTVVVGEGSGGGGGGSGGSGGGGETSTPTGGPTETSAPGPVTTQVVAQNIAFDTNQINLPANQASTLTFDNQDAGVPHNIAIFTDDTLADVKFRGDVVTGPTTVEYQIPALDPGTYYFHCDIHPNMSGTVVVG